MEFNLTLKAEDIVPIRDLVLEVSGVYFDENKFYFIEKRITKRMKATNSSSAKEYYRLIKFAEDKKELDELIVSLTTNETYFYRNIPQLESFAEEALPLILAEKRKKKDFRLKIWSAACSSGDEPYTVYILLKENVPDFSKWKIEIVGTDIDHYILEKARKGCYDRRAVKDIPAKILSQYFVEESGLFKIHDEAKKYVEFRKVNLMDRREMRRFSEMDFVFCRNVLIYFDADSRKEVVNRIYDSLNKGGFIFLGHSESVGKLSAAFKLVKFNKSLSYQK
ncbi:MAG: protein-glutamate O-methyltransferase CheR [Deltaproteobacteria bacterium]|nr:protein-glutamate O-methyltransferase CheR [Deltaproteobacteria bacterium]